MDDYHWWREALAGRMGEVHEDQPQPGFYKLRNGRDGPWKPVAIWKAGGALVARVADESRDPLDVWVWCAKHPVPKLDAKHAFEHGAWPGDVPLATNAATLSLQEEIADAIEQAEAFLRATPIDGKIAADTAANWRARLLDLGKQADNQRDAEKRPHDDAAKAVQAKWKPSIDRAAETANAIRDVITKWLREETARAEREAAERRAAAEAETNRMQAELRAKAEEMRQAIAAQGTTVSDSEFDKMVPVLPAPVVAEPPRIQAGGQRGRKTGLRTITRYVIADYALALAAVKDHPDVRAAVEKVCAAQSRVGIAVPGVEAKQEQVAA